MISEPLRLAFCLATGMATVVEHHPAVGDATRRARYALADALLALRAACPSPDPVDTAVLEDLGYRMRCYVESLR